MGLLSTFLAYRWGRHRGEVAARRAAPIVSPYCCECCSWCGSCDEDSWGCTCGWLDR